LLAASGIYGVLCQWVALRRREIGIRAAIGAAPGNLARMVLIEALATTGLGLLSGLAAAAVVSRMLGHLLYGVASRRNRPDVGGPGTLAGAQPTVRRGPSGSIGRRSALEGFLSR
jgi:ABC-type antimicrobial peptide transport system permease subunit